MSSVSIETSAEFRVHAFAHSPVLRYIKRISEGMLLCLQPNLDDLHRRNDQNRFCRTGEKTSQEHALGGELAILIRQGALVGYRIQSVD